MNLKKHLFVNFYYIVDKTCSLLKWVYNRLQESRPRDHISAGDIEVIIGYAHVIDKQATYHLLQ